MSKTAPDLSANGWPLLTADHYIDAVPLYTQELADKLDNGDADVAAAINAAARAEAAAAAIPQLASGMVDLVIPAGGPSATLINSFTIGFPAGRFSGGVPRVAVTLRAGYQTRRISVVVTGVTLEAFTVALYATYEAVTATSAPLMWVAIKDA